MAMLAKSRLSGLKASTSGRTSVIMRAATALPKQYKAVKPVGDRLLVAVDPEEARTVGGVILPSNARNKPNTGSVVSAGDVKHVKVDETVVYSKFAGTELEVGGKEHVLLKEEDVIGVLSATKNIAQIKPLSDRIVIKMAEAESKTSGGVLLNVDNAEKPTFGTVVAVGPGKADEESGQASPVNVPVGATVMYSKYSGTEFEEDGVSYIIVRESDVLAQLA